MIVSAVTHYVLYVIIYAIPFTYYELYVYY
jgi:hypothetical protein